MIAVGIKELKAHLSSYVDRVKGGEEVIITDRGHEIALVVPISRERRVVTTMMEHGRVRWSGGKPTGASGIRAKGIPVSETVLSDRR